MKTLILLFVLINSFCKSGRRRIGCLRHSRATKEPTTEATQEVTREVNWEATKTPNRELTKGVSRLVTRVVAVLSLQSRAW